MLDYGDVPQKPYEVIFAVRLLYYSIAFDIVNTILNWDALLSLMPSDISFDKNLFWLFTKVFLVAIIMWLICKISLRHNWARIFFFLGFILSIPISIPTMIAMFHHSMIFIFISVAITIFQFTGLSLLFSDAGNSWFKKLKNVSKEEY